MSSIPDTTESLTDGQLAFATENVDKIVTCMGISTRGSLALLYAFTDTATVQTTLGSGPLVEDICHQLDVAGGTVYGQKILGSVAGTNSAVAQTGAGPLPTLTGNPIDALKGRIKIVTGGIVGTATYQLSLDDGDNYGPETLTQAIVALAEGLSAPTSVTSLGTTPPVITVTGTPLREVDLRVEALTTGALAVWTGRYSLDAGVTWTGFTSAATVVLTGTGLTLNIAAGTAAVDNRWSALTPGMRVAFTAGTYVAGEVYSWTSTQAGYSSTDMASAFDTAKADARAWDLMHLVGIPEGANDAAKVTAAAAMAAALAVKLDAAFLAHRPIRAVMDGPDVANDAAGDTAFINGIVGTIAPRVGISGGFCDIRSPVSKRTYRRPQMWAIVSHSRRRSISDDLAEVGKLGNVGRLHASVTSIERDEAKRPGLNAARIMTLRTWIGFAGFFVTEPKMLAAPGSDYELLQHGRIIDLACRVARRKGVELIKAKQRTNADGTIYEIDARAMEREINSALDIELRQPGHVVTTSVLLNRTDNVMSTKKVRHKVRARPFSYPKDIEAEIGFEALIPIA